MQMVEICQLGLRLQLPVVPLTGGIRGFFVCNIRLTELWASIQTSTKKGPDGQEVDCLGGRDCQEQASTLAMLDEE